MMTPCMVCTISPTKPAASEVPSALAIPKSMTIGTGLASTSVTRMFEGFKSRCRMAF